MKTQLLVATAVLITASNAHAARKADLAVDISEPSGLYVYQQGRYQVEVENNGNRNALGVTLTIDLPQTQTSPQVHLMGDLGAVDSRCSLNAQTLTCSLGKVRKGKSKTVFFDIAMPYSTAPLVIDAAATTTSPEANTNDDNDSLNASLLTYALTVPATVAITNRHCTGTSLTSFFECETSPGSISSHNTTFNSGGGITFQNAPPTFTGQWSQPASDRLVFDYYDSGNLVASFDGRGVSSNCFEGLTTFPGSSYMAMYEVCF